MIATQVKKAKKLMLKPFDMQSSGWLRKSTQER